jgi:lipoprotein-anchoring transpeptidase ErfK/SrfK
MLRRRAIISTGIGLAAGAAVAGCSAANASSSKWMPPGSKVDANDPTGSAPASTVNFTVTPAADAKDVSPADAITVSIDNGKIESCSVTSADNKTVAGEIASDGKSWKSTGSLGYDKVYTVAVTGTDAKGAPAQHSSTFNTLKPAGGTSSITFQANPMAAMKDGATYGVGQPVIVFFSKTVKDKAAAEAAMKVTTSPEVEGRWHWVSGQSAHWRPEKYWASGTKVTVQTNLLGVNVGGNVYGSGNNSIRFTIGPSRIAIADSNTHYMQVFINGAMVKNIPVSMGKGGSTIGSKGETIEFWTRSGVHVVMEKDTEVVMSSASYGITDPKNPNYYRDDIKLACRISLSGEYVHMADWNIPKQGKENSSHGCINVGPANAQWFYDTFGVGDVVEVRNTPKKLPLTDGLGDWTIPWSSWGKQ